MLAGKHIHQILNSWLRHTHRDMIHYDPFVAACMIGHLEVLSACDKSGEWQVALSLLTVPWLKNDQSDQGPPEDFWVTLRSCPGNFTHFGVGHLKKVMRKWDMFR